MRRRKEIRSTAWGILRTGMLLVALLPVGAVTAADAPAAQPLKIPWGPLLQNLTPTGVTVVWASGNAAEQVLEYGTAADKLGTSLKPTTDHPERVVITGLTPGKTYYYRITIKSADGSETADSGVAAFTTPQPDVTKFSFAVIADTHTSRCNYDLAKLMGELKPDFVLHGGDRSPSVVSGTLRPYKGIIASVPMYMARGNHDSADKQKMVSAVPGPGDNQYFAFTWGNARIICVNTEDRKGAKGALKKGGKQYEWLESELKNCRQRWKFVFQHIPVYSAWGGGLTADLDDERALLATYGVHAVFQGHMHNYDRSHPLKGKAIAKDGGVIYITASGACGGKEPFKKGTDFWFLAKTFNGEPFLGMVYVDGDKAKIEFMTDKRKVFDTIELHQP